MAELRVRVLGGLVVEGFEPRAVGSRKARTLLAALAVARGAPVGADVIAEIVWGDELPAKPAEQVGVLVSRLRGVLGADRLARTDAGYAFRPDWLDLDELEVGTAEAMEQLRGGEPVEARLRATMALDVARGPLLPEEDGPWLDAPRAAVARTLSAAALVAAEAALAVGDSWGAAAAAGVGLDRDPYDEALLRALMRAHAAAGRPASALAAYAELRARLADDLGVSPSADTEALHLSLLGEEPSGAAATPVQETWDPLVDRARLELAAFDVDAARRDAEEAVRRGAGAGALEVAGWVAYYRRDFPAALRWAEEGAAGSPDDERRASCLALAGRVLHSSGDLAGSELRLVEAAGSTVPGVRNVAEVWLSGLRTHQGRPDEALRLVDRGATDAAALRHPFVMPHALFHRAYALGQQGRLAELVQAVDRWAAVQDEMGEGSARYLAPVANVRSWALAAAGRHDEATERSEWAYEHSAAFDEPRAHAMLDLAQLDLDRGDLSAAERSLEAAEVPADDDDGTMVWHQHQRVGLLRARLAWRHGDVDATESAAQAVLDDARRRGSGRSAAQAEVLVLLARARRGDGTDPERFDRVLAQHDAVAGLEAWRATAEVAAVTGDHALVVAARRRATLLLDRAGDDAPSLARWVDAELGRLGLS